MTAYELALAWSGLFLLAGLLTGTWKYRCIAASEDATAPIYVDIAHRASLMYAFATVVLALLAERSVWTEGWNLLGIWLSVLYFAAAIGGYILHGLLRDTDNQLRKPHRIGSAILPPLLMSGFMWSLVVAEIAGMLIVFSGFVAGL